MSPMGRGSVSPVAEPWMLERRPIDCLPVMGTAPMDCLPVAGICCAAENESRSLGAMLRREVDEEDGAKLKRSAFLETRDGPSDWRLLLTFSWLAVIGPKVVRRGAEAILCVCVVAVQTKVVEQEGRVR